MHSKAPAAAAVPDDSAPEPGTVEARLTQALAELAAAREREDRQQTLLLALHELQNELTRQATTDALCRAAVELGRRALGYDRMSVWLVGGTPDTVRGTYGIDEHGQLRDERTSLVAVTPGSTMGGVIAGKARLVVERGVPLRDSLAAAVGTGTHAVAALWNGGEVIGCLSADNLLTGHPIADQDGEFLELLATTLGHLYTQKRTAERLQASEDKFARAFRLSPDCISLTRLSDGTYLEVNTGFTTTLGYTEEEALGHSSLPDDLGVWVSDYDRVTLLAGIQARGEVIGLEAPFRCKDGTIKMGLMSARTVEIDGEPCLLSISRDITERYEAAQALAAERERLRVTLRSIGDGVIATDVAGQVVLLNRVAETLTGWTQHEAVGRSLHDVLGLEPPAEPAATDDAVRLVARNGEARLVTRTAAPIRHGDGRVTGEVLVLRDVTVELRLRDEVQRMAKLDSLGVLAGGIAHDFNNLLMTIAGNTDLARAAVSEADLDGAADSLADAAQAALRARGLTQQLLTFAKGGAPARRPLPLLPLVAETATFALAGSPCRCEVTPGDDLWPVLADSGQLAQVLHNLLLNACQAMPDGGTITVSLHNLTPEQVQRQPLPAGRYVELAVADGGGGIEPAALKKVFDPFFSTKPHGRGLGLASAWSIVRAHGGHLSVESTPGVGSRFSVLLPASELAVPAAPATPPPTGAGRPQRILVLDDEPTICRVLRRMLEPAGHTVVTCHEGLEAIALWRQGDATGQPFDLAILDLTLPGGIGGQQVAATIRELDPQALLIASSGYSTGSVMADCQAYGFTERLAKPYVRQDVLALVATLTAAPARKVEVASD